MKKQKVRKGYNGIPQQKGFFEMPATPRRNPRSVRNVRKRMLAQERGLFFGDGMEWTSKDDDDLLDGLLYFHWCTTSPNLNVLTFQSEMGRTLDSVFTRLRKLCTCHREVVRYEPGLRIDRTGSPWIDWDFYVIKLATNKSGARNGAYSISFIASLLNRSIEEVRAKIKQILGAEREALPGFYSSDRKQKMTRKEQLARIQAAVKEVVQKSKEIQNALRELRKEKQRCRRK